MVHVYVFIEMIFNMGISVRVDNKNNFLCCALASQNIVNCNGNTFFLQCNNDYSMF